VAPGPRLLPIGRLEGRRDGRTRRPPRGRRPRADSAGLDDDPATREAYREFLRRDLAEQTGVDLRDRIVVEESACVREFADRYGDPQGTALGLAHTLLQTGPFRPDRRRGPDGLHYAGAYTTPGIGMPMCLISGERAARAVLEDAPVGADVGRSPSWAD
jgi:phytoene desaturase